jgi:dienelactone hydrolase
MDVTFTCKSCGKKYAIDAKYAGKRIKCQKCAQPVQVPPPLMTFREGPATVAQPVKSAPPRPDTPTQNTAPQQQASGNPNFDFLLDDANADAQRAKRTPSQPVTPTRTTAQQQPAFNNPGFDYLVEDQRSRPAEGVALGPRIEPPQPTPRKKKRKKRGFLDRLDDLPGGRIAWVLGFCGLFLMLGAFAVFSRRGNVVAAGVFFLASIVFLLGGGGWTIGVAFRHGIYPGIRAILAFVSLPAALLTLSMGAGARSGSLIGIIVMWVYTLGLIIQNWDDFARPVFVFLGGVGLFVAFVVSTIAVGMRYLPTESPQAVVAARAVALRDSRDYPPAPPYPSPGPGIQIEPGVTLYEIQPTAPAIGERLVPPPPHVIPGQRRAPSRGGTRRRGSGPPPGAPAIPGFPKEGMPPIGSRGLPGHSAKLWLYLPDGDHAPQSLPCIFIAGAGSNLITGMNLGDGDRAEHLPWVRAGFAVLAYELDGHLGNLQAAQTEEIKEASTRFFGARAGLVNAHNALEYVLQKVPQVDPKRLYSAGHSSAGTMSLLFAEAEPRLAGCVAFAPVSDVERRLGPMLLRLLSPALPNLQTNVARYSPKHHESELTCPVFLFHAKDDSNVPVTESQECANRLKKLRKSVTLELVPTGDHYDAMVNEGISRAINWVRGLPSETNASHGSAEPGSSTTNDAANPPGGVPAASH